MGPCIMGAASRDSTKCELKLSDRKVVAVGPERWLHGQRTHPLSAPTSGGSQLLVTPAPGDLT